MTITSTTASSATSIATASSSTDGGHTVTVEHLTKHYGDHTVVDDLSFTVPAGPRHWLSRPQRLGQVDDHEDHARPRRCRSRAQPRSAGTATGTCATRPALSAQ